MKALFVCIHNAGRSQMAQAFAERTGIDARSAGSAPGDHLHPEVIEVMDEVDIDISGRTPNKLTQEDLEWTDLVVTMGCGDACPVLPGTEYIDWDLSDPKGRPIDEVRAIRNEVEHRVLGLLDPA